MKTERKARKLFPSSTNPSYKCRRLASKSHSYSLLFGAIAITLHSSLALYRPLAFHTFILLHRQLLTQDLNLLLDRFDIISDAESIFCQLGLNLYVLLDSAAIEVSLDLVDDVPKLLEMILEPLRDEVDLVVLVTNADTSVYLDAFFQLPVTLGLLRIELALACNFIRSI